MTTPPALLLDERGAPPLRARIGELLAAADDASFALTRVRLAVLDLDDRELGRLQRCRVLLGQLDASMLMDAPSGPRAGPSAGSPTPLSHLLRFAASGRLEVRSAGLVAWTPDFAVVHRGSARTGLIGSIQFGSPELVTGPTFTMTIEDPDAIRLLQDRFDEVWSQSHDVLPAIQSVLQRAAGLDGPAAAGSGGADPGGAVRRGGARAGGAS